MWKNNKGDRDLSAILRQDRTWSTYKSVIAASRIYDEHYRLV